MLAIVAHHYSVHGGVLYHTESQNTDVFLLALAGYGKMGVDLFVLIGAYFMVDRPRRGKALASIYAQVLPVSWGVLALVLATGAIVPAEDQARNAVAPVLFGQWWFVTAYVMLILIAPYLSIVAKRLTRIQLQRLLMVGGVLWSILTMIDDVTAEISNLGWFAYLFFLAAYVKLHGMPGTRRTWIVASVASIVAMAFVLVAVAELRFSWDRGVSSIWWPRYEIAGQESILSVITALCVFVAGVKTRPWTSKAVNYWAAATFGVYLIHDNRIIRFTIWRDILDTASAAGQWWLPLHALASTLAVYLACSVVIFALQPTVFRAMHVVTEAVRTRVEARLTRGADTSDPQRSTS